MSDEKSTQLTEEQLQAQLQEALKASKASTETPLEVHLETGQVYRGKTQDELIQQLVKAQEEASKTIKARKDEVETERTLRQQLQAQLVENQKKAPETPPANGGKFDNATYWQIWEKDPLGAQNYLDQFRFGIPIDQVRQAIEHSNAVADEFEQHKAVAVFHARHPEFPGGDEAAQLILQRMAERDLPLTTENLEYSYFTLVNEKKLTPVVETKNDEETTANEPPPHLGGSGAPPEPSILDQANEMSDKDLEAFLRKSGVLKG